MSARRFADLPSGAFLSGIAFDTVGRFGYRLLVTALFGESMTLYALDCRGRSSVILQAGPRVEGGIAVAPRTFGRFAGQLIAPDEHSGRIFAFDHRGRTRVVSQYRFPAGGDIGVESVGFVPPGFDCRGAAYLADLGAPGAPTPGTSSLLTLRGRQLVRAGLRPGTCSSQRRAVRSPSPSAAGSAAPSARSGVARLPRTGRVISPSSRRRALRGRRLNGSGQQRKAPASFRSR